LARSNRYFSILMSVIGGRPDLFSDGIDVR